ncbi:MAG: hypothetical protein ACRD5R_00595 [Candidatus Acidiferrales bacterium]
MLGSEFASCWLKIARAEVHAKTVCDEIASWEQQCPYVLTKIDDPQGYFYSINVELNPVPDWDRWSLIFGDFIHNLRSALDHFVYAAAICQTKINPPVDRRRLQFPISMDSKTFSNGKNGIQSLSEAVQASIEGVQPYNRRHRLLPPLLGLLRDFDNSDKHRLLKLASALQHDGHARIECPDGHSLKSITYFDGEIQTRADILAFTIEPPTLEVKYPYESTFKVGVSHEPGPTGIKATSVKTLVELLSGEVRTIIETIGMKV